MPDDTPATPATPATTTVTEDNAYNIENFTRAPFAASYGGTILGGTEGPISINPEFEYEDISCNQAGGQAIVRILKSIKYRISATFKEVDTVIGAVFGLQDITKAAVGTIVSGGELTLTAIGAGNSKVYTFHNVTSKITKYDLDGENIHGVEVEFETLGNGDANGNILTVTGTAAGLGAASESGTGGSNSGSGTGGSGD